MRLEPTPRPDHVLRVSARLVTASTILHLSADELERAVSQEQMENPALDVRESRLCLFCGTPLFGQSCSTCGYFVQPTQVAPTSTESSISYESSPANEREHFYEIYDRSPVNAEGDDEFDLVASIPTNETLAEVLLQQLEALVSPEDALIAEQLVGNLNERGYLEISLREVADQLHVPIERVAYVLSQLQTLEPIGIGARDLRECLLIQLEAVSEQERPHPLAYTLIDRYLKQLGHNHFYVIARELKV